MAAFSHVKQIAVIVHDLDIATRTYSDRFGIGPWQLHVYRDWPVTQRGVVERLDFRIALAMVGAVEWELIEPLDDRSIFAEFLRTHGEGIQHIAFGTTDPAGTLLHRDDGSAVERLGFGEVPGRDGSALEYIYFDTAQELGFVAEAHVIPEGWVRPDPSGTYPPSA